jgi:Family of unknown function (DUF6228)
VPEDPDLEFVSDDDDRSVARLSYHPADPDFGSLVIEVKIDGLVCETNALSLRGDGLDTFLAGLATDWRGWDGTRTWVAHDGGIGIEATHRGSRVELALIVHRDYGRGTEWRVRVPVLIAPGEPLARLARASAELFTVR